MGGGFVIDLFIGPSVRKTYCEWIYFFIRKRDDIIKEIKQEEAYKQYIKGYENDDDDDDVVISDWYIDDGRINDDIQKLYDFLQENGLTLSRTSSFYQVDITEFRIGRVLEQEFVSQYVRPSDEDVEFWESYGFKDLVVFPGIRYT